MNVRRATSVCAPALLAIGYANAGQVPGSAQAPDIAVSSRDRVYVSDQTSNTVSVVNPSNEKLLGVIHLGDPLPDSINPLYKGQLLVHGMGFSPDHRTLAVVSVGSNSVTFIDTATNEVKHTTYIGRSPHEAMFTPDGKEVWATVRGEDYVQIIDAVSYEPLSRVEVPNGPGMTIFSPDGRFAYICSSFIADTVVIDVLSHDTVAHVTQVSPFCPNISATPDGKQVWMTLKDTGKTQIFNAQPPFNPIATLDTGPITNHVNIVRNARGQFAYVTVGGMNVVKVFTTDEHPRLVATIPVGELPHGLWPSGDGSRIYVGLENGTAITAIDTLKNEVIATIASGESPQALTYVPDAVPQGAGTKNLAPLAASGEVHHLALADVDSRKLTTTVTVNNQGVLDLIEAAATGLDPNKGYLLALSSNDDGESHLLPIAKFKANASGAAIVTTVGPLRKVVATSDPHQRHASLVIAHVLDNGEAGSIAQTER